MISDSYEKLFKDKQRIMTVFAHPDDTEIYAGGLIKRLRNDGKDVLSIKMSNGDKGSRQEDISQEELREVRFAGNESAMQVLGIEPQHSIFLDVGDGYIENNHEQIGMIAKQIRLFNPDLIITHNPEDVIIRHGKDDDWINHRDHRNTGQNVLDAAYPYSRDLLFFPEHFEDPNATSCDVVEYLIVDSYDHADEVFINIDDVFETKLEALTAHQSQFSPERARDTLEFMAAVDGEAGKWERFRYVLAD